MASKEDLLANDHEFLSQTNQKSLWRRTFAAMGPDSLRGGILIMIVSALGTGIYTFHQLLDNIGIIWALLLTIYFALIFFMTSLYIIDALFHYPSSENISDLVRSCLGPTVAKIHDFVFLFYCLLVELAILLGVSKTLYVNFESNIWKIFKVAEANRNFPYFNFYFCYAISPIVFGLVMLKSIEIFRYISLFSFAINIYIVVVSMIQAPLFYEVLVDEGKAVYNIYSFGIVDLVKSFGLLLYAYNCIPNIVSVSKAVGQQSRRRLRKLFLRTFMILLLLFVLFGTAAYISVGQEYAQKLDLFIFRKPVNDGDKDWLMFIGRTLLILSLTIAIGLNANPLKMIIFEMLKKKLDNRSNLILSLILTAGITVVVSFCDSITSYVGFAGTMCVTFLSIILPFSMALKTGYYNHGLGKFFLKSHLVLFTIMGAWGTYLSVKRFFEKH